MSVANHREAQLPGRTRVSQKLRSLLTLFLLIATSIVSAYAQDKSDPLTEAEVDQVREVADQPLERVKLYMKFIGQRTDAIAEIVGDTRIQDKPTKLRQLFQEYTRLVDELQDNLDNYDEAHSDIRKALKVLVPESKKWLDIVNKPPPNPSYDFPRKTAAEAGQSLNEQVTKLQIDQEKFFAEQKKEKNQKDKEGYTPPPN